MFTFALIIGVSSLILERCFIAKYLEKMSRHYKAVVKSKETKESDLPDYLPISGGEKR